MAPVKVIRPVLGDAPQCRAQFGLQEDLLVIDVAEIVEEIRAARESFIVVANIIDQDFSRAGIHSQRVRPPA